MPGSLMYLSKDPNWRKGPEKFYLKKDRGPGLYYHRGSGQYSKYSRARDSKIKGLGFNKNNIGLPKENKLLHTMDGIVFRR